MVEESVYTTRGWLWEYKPCWLGENRKQLVSSFSKGVISSQLPQLPVTCTYEMLLTGQMHSHFTSEEGLLNSPFCFECLLHPPNLSQILQWISGKNQVFGKKLLAVWTEKHGCTRKAGWWVWVLGNACICRINSCITKKNIWGWVNRSSQMLNWSRTHFSCSGKCSCSAKIWNVLFLLFCLVLEFQVYKVSYCIFRQNKIHLIWWRQICRGFFDSNE